LSDEDVWSATIPDGLDSALWPFVLLTILWRLWDSRNGEVFRSKTSNYRAALNNVCDDFVTWRKRLPTNLVSSLDGWRSFLVGCNATSVI
jgi:hypothetical protein